MDSASGEKLDLLTSWPYCASEKEVNILDEKFSNAMKTPEKPKD
jgi:hypothetical protein